MGFDGTDRFEVRRRLGAGVFGVVYEAFDRERFRRVALKTLPGIDAPTLFRFKSEFSTLQTVEHPNLVGLFDLLEVDGTWLYSMELVEGCDFIRYVRGGGLKPGSLTGAEARTDGDTIPVGVEPIGPGSGSGSHSFDDRLLRHAFAQAALGLLALHASGLVHRNLKPPNIRVTPEGRVVLLDYGLGLVGSGGVRTDSRELDSVTYMAPEQALAGSGLPEVDWYALGVVLYEALTGKPPYAGRSQLEILMSKERGDLPPAHVIVPGLSPELDLICQDLLSLDPQERPNGRELLERWGVDPETAAKAERYTSTTSQLAQAGPFVGREKELEALRAAFDETRHGGVRTVSLVSESGLGKTALLRRFAEIAVAEVPTTVVLAGRCYERESVAFQALEGVVDALARYMRRLGEEEAGLLVPRRAALLPRVFPALGRVEVLAQASQPNVDVKDPHELRGRAFTALRELLFRIAEAHPLILIVDAMQWADADSLLVLEDIVREPDAPSLLLLLATRPESEESESSSESGERVAARLAGVERTELRLGPLDRRAAPELARLLIRRAHAKGLDPFEIAVEARGHPLYIDELVRHAVAVGRNGKTRPRLEEAIWARAFSLSPVTRRVLELSVVAGAPLLQETLADAAKLGVSEVAEHLAELRAANLLRGRGARRGLLVEPYHDCVREAVLVHMEADTRAERHERLAVALEGGGAGTDRPELLVRHLEAAGQSDKAAELAAEAARRANKTLAFDRAARLFGTALRLGSEQGEALVELRRGLGEALANAGRGPEAADAFLAAADVAEGAVRLDCQRCAAEQLLQSGHIERGIEALNALLATHGVQLPRSPRRAVASVLWRRALLRLRGLRWKERHESEVSKRDLTRIDIYKTVSQGIGMVDTLRGADFQVRGLSLALKTGERSRVGRLLAQEVVYVAAQGARHTARARVLHAEVRRIAEKTEDPFLLAWGQSGEGLITYFEGRFPEAAEIFAKAEAVFRGQTAGSWWEISSVGLFRLLSLTRTGVFTDLALAYDKYLRDAAQRGDRYSETTVKRACCAVWLAKDRPEDGLNDLELTSWPLPEQGFHLQHWYHLQARGEIAIYQGNAVRLQEELRADFERLQRSLLTRIEIVRVHSRWLFGHLALERAQAGAERARALAEASRSARRLGRERVGYARCWALLLRAGIDNLSGDEHAALDSLTEAAQCAKKLGLQLCEAVANRRRGQLLGGDEGAAAVARVDEQMRGLGVVNAERMSEIIAPGF